MKPDEDTQRLAVAVAQTYEAAVRAFGQGSDDLQVITYDEFDGEVDLSELGALALDAGSQAATVLAATLTASPARLHEVRVILGDAAANGAIAQVLAQHPAWVVTDVTATPDGRPLLVLGQRRDEQVVSLALAQVPPRPSTSITWPGDSARDSVADATPDAAATSAPTGAPARRSGRVRKVVAALALLCLVVIATLFVAGLTAGVDGVLLVLAAAILALQVVTLLGVAFVARHLRRTGGEGALLRSLLMKRTERVLKAVRTSREHQRQIERNLRELRAVVDDQGAAQRASQNFLAEFASQQKQAQKAASETDRAPTRN